MTNGTKIYVTFCDINRLSIMLDSSRTMGGDNQSSINILKNKLKRAQIVAPESIPKDVITMNSTFVFRNLVSGKTMTYTVVYPKDADISTKRISILTPVGISLFGQSCGDRILANIPSGTLRLKIERVLYQPEAKGVYLS